MRDAVREVRRDGLCDEGQRANENLSSESPLSSLSPMTAGPVAGFVHPQWGHGYTRARVGPSP
jgi:hypothetical protein